MDKKTPCTSNTEYYWLIPLIITAMVLFGHSPVLFSTYLRQDDLTATTWNIHHFKRDPGLNNIWEIFRPVCGIFIVISDFVSHNMRNAWIMRFINIMFLSGGAVLLYRWQRKFGAEKIFAACFAICAFLTQSSQIISSTANYTVLVATIVMAQGACFLFYRGFVERERRKAYYAYGVILLFISLLSYPLGSPYIFVFLFIYFLHNPQEKCWKPHSLLSFMQRCLR